VIVVFFNFMLVREIGIFMFSICINIGVVATFGYERIRTALLVVALSSAAIFASIFIPHARWAVPTHDPGYVERNLMISFIVATISATMIVYYFIRANFRVESLLVQKEKSLTKKNEELNKVNVELDKFFYSASHDLRAPLTSIQGLIQLMELTDDAAELKKYASMLKGRAQNLDQFIRKISEYSSNVRQDARWEPMNLKTLLRENLENLRFYPTAEKIKVYLDIPDKVELVSDPVRLQIVFGNLLSNAIKYHDFNKPEPFIKIRCAREADWFRISVEDNGSGIRRESLSKIFGMFYRAHRQAEGTGLGLYIVKDALDKLHGKIEVTSVYGEGSTFSVFLPAAPPGELETVVGV